MNLTMTGSDFALLTANSAEWAGEAATWRQQIAAGSFENYTEGEDVTREPSLDWARAYWLRSYADVILARSYLAGRGWESAVLSDLRGGDGEWVILTDYISVSDGGPWPPGRPAGPQKVTVTLTADQWLRVRGWNTWVPHPPAGDGIITRAIAEAAARADEEPPPASFRVGGFDDEDGKPTQPVQVTCTGCGTLSPWFTYRDDGGADRTASLGDLVSWVQNHHCPEAFAAGAAESGR